MSVTLKTIALAEATGNGTTDTFLPNGELIGTLYIYGGGSAGTVGVAASIDGTNFSNVRDTSGNLLNSEASLATRDVAIYAKVIRITVSSHSTGTRYVTLVTGKKSR